ncbi:MAG: NERD domain-containing protein/DEAD/DEAH box helicase [Verrucomicrobia bacterium]|nr:NERD domain-containing protein/DEAD/DEAH box helicase [Verrucomicrobiota bacterium]
MAKLSPPYIDKDCKSTGERMIFDMLKKDSFTEDWIVLHSLNLSQHTKRLYGEIDFLLLIPNAGVFVMEVKGGDVRCKNGEWEFIDRHGNVNRNKSPFNQARDAMFSLQTEIKKEFGAKHRFNKIQFGFLVAFPQVNFDKHSVEYEQWQIFDKTNYNSNHETFFKTLIQQFTEKHKTQLWFSPTESLPSRQDLEELCHFLRGDFMRVRSAKERLAEFDSQVKTYTEEQFGVLESIDLNERSLVQGSAGTGKTMIAIESAIRAAAEGKKVFLTCYNRIIGEWMQKQLEGWSNITVSSLHSYLFELTKGFDYDKTQENKQDFYSKYLPNLMKEFFKIGVKGKFDKLIIDEGQDLIREEYLGLFDSMLTNGLANGYWEIYGDFERQAIFAQLSKSEMLDLLKTFGHHSKHLLRINCRNTKEIGEETSLISGFEKPPFLLEYLEGLPVAYYFYRDEAHQRQILNEQLKKVAYEDLPLNEIVILSPKKFENSCAKSLPGYSTKEIKTANEVSATQKYFGFATVQSYKGMEGNYILITDIEDLSSEVAKSLLYVGMSRARYGLILLISEAIQRQYYEILQNKLR